MLQLISATPSPYARKVRIALAEKAIPFELLTEVPWDGTTATKRHNPLEKLPVLLLPDGSSVYESHFILEWLEVKHPTPPLVPQDPDERLAARQIEVVADGMCDAVVLMFWEGQRADPSPAWTARQQRKVEGGLRMLADRAAGREWIVGDRFGLADIAAGAVLRYMDVRCPAIPWRDIHPGLAALSDRLERRPSFAATTPVAQSITDRVV